MLDMSLVCFKSQLKRATQMRIIYSENYLNGNKRNLIILKSIENIDLYKRVCAMKETKI